MGLTDDQRAMLRLLAQREEGYEDIAALKGISVEEVRAEVKAALAGLSQDDTALAAGREPETPSAAGPVAGERGALRAGQGPSSTPLTPTPPAEERTSSAPVSPRAAAAPASSRPSVKPGPRPPRDRRRLAELIGGALVVLLVVLFATDTIDLGGGDSSDSDDSASAGQIATPTSGKAPTQATLEAVDGGDASGQALFGRLKNQVVLAIAAKGLEPSGQGESYAVTLVRSGEERVPIAAAKVGKSGEIGAQYPVASNVLGLLANGFDQMEVSLVVNKELRTALTEAQRDEGTPEFDSTEVLQGDVTGPIVEAGD